MSRRDLPEVPPVSKYRWKRLPAWSPPGHIGRQEGPTPESQGYLEKAQLSFLPHVLELAWSLRSPMSRSFRDPEFLLCPSKWLRELLPFGAEAWPDMGVSSGLSLSQCGVEGASFRDQGLVCNHNDDQFLSRVRVQVGARFSAL